MTNALNLVAPVDTLAMEFMSRCNED